MQGHEDSVLSEDEDDSQKRRFPGITDARRLAFILAFVITLSPLAIDVYLPAIPAIAQDYLSLVEDVQLSVSAYLIGYAFGQLLGGPLSDIYGRRFIGVIGVGIFCLSSFALSFTDQLELFLFWRVCQAVGGGFIMVNPHALVRDLFTGKDASRLLGLVSFIMMLAPLVAPALGVGLLELWGWRSIFVMLGVYSLILVPVFLMVIPETRGKRPTVLPLETAPPSRGLFEAFRRYGGVVRHRRGWGYLGSLALGWATMFVFLTHAAFIYLDYFDYSEETFPLLFGANIALMMVMNRLNSFFLRYRLPEDLLKTAVFLQIAGALLFFVPVAFGVVSIALVMPGIVLAIGALGMHGPNAMTCYLANFGDRPGAATAVSGAATFLMGAGLGSLSSLFVGETLFPVALTMFLSALMGGVLLWLLALRKA
ncbi:multidrug effflux MFS transporter [Kiloniella sp. b19]|uniref:multidrug effflux MFS transporter n=1 Tax=Kiloniella sp. GXU_MW_B19 TaxID=3141326 RepID=UPI0031D39934